MYYNGDALFLTEACEYKKSFLALSPDYAVVLNAEVDHPDTYGSLNDVVCAFDDFLDKTKNRAFLITDTDYAHMSKCTGGHITRCGNDSKSDYCLSEITEYKAGFYGFSVAYRGEPLVAVKLGVSGKHNVYNALAAVAVAHSVGVEADAIRAGLESFGGVARRFQRCGTVRGAEVIVDYAHHPSEVKAAIKNAKGLKPKCVKVVFQPHTYSRTKRLFGEFLTCFNDADKLYITKAYAAREAEDLGLSAYDLYREIKKKSMFCTYFEHTAPLAETLISEAEEGDIILILGAGDIYMLADLLIDF
jgi:UDP-N-acetylmuramate--alanine ligase